MSTPAFETQILERTTPSRDIRCSACHAPATLMVMHRCGAPGGPCCAKCWQAHLDKLEFAGVLNSAGEVTLWCRHCRQDDVPLNHVYAIGLEART